MHKIVFTVILIYFTSCLVAEEIIWETYGTRKVIDNIKLNETMDNYYF